MKYKLRDWLFSRQRYWGEPFPILLDEDGYAYAVDESELPVRLPEIEDFKPTGTPEPPLSKVASWVRVERDGQVFTRETNTMPQWAGSCWYYLRYIDPHNHQRFVDPAKEAYWMPVDLYVGGVEHAVLHLLYSRFWHKVLFDLGHVSTAEPFQRLVNQGLILGETEYHVFEDATGKPVSASEVRDVGEEASDAGGETGRLRPPQRRPLRRSATQGRRRRAGRRGLQPARQPRHSRRRPQLQDEQEPRQRHEPRRHRPRLRRRLLPPLRNVHGPAGGQKPWNTRDIVGMQRFLNAVWRNLIGAEDLPAGTTRAKDEPIADALDRQMHRTIKKVGEDIASLRFNTAIAELIKLNNEITPLPSVPRALAENFVLLLAPFAPHIAEEIWERLGHHRSLSRRPWPTYDPAKLVESTMELPVQVNGKLRDRITVPADADEQTILAAAMEAPKVRPWTDGKTVVKRLYVAGKLVNLVVK